MALVTTTMGMDPITASLVANVASNFLSSIFGGSSGSSAPAGPTPAQLAALARAQADAAATTRNWLIGGGLLLAAGLVVVLVVRK